MTNNQNLEHGQIVFIKGTVRFSHITRRYEGEALKQRIEQQKSINVKYPTLKPHTTLSLTNVSLLPSGANNQLNDADTFVAQKFYSSKSAELGQCFQIDSKGVTLPKLGWIDENRQLHAITNPEGEIAQSTDVIAAIRLFYSKEWNRWGMELDTVASIGEMKYYVSSATNELADAFARLGVTVNEPLTPLPEGNFDDQSASQPVTETQNTNAQANPFANTQSSEFGPNGLNMPGNINTQQASQTAVGVTNTGSPFSSAPQQTQQPGNIPWNNNNGGNNPPAALAGITFNS